MRSQGFHWQFCKLLLMKYFLILQKECTFAIKTKSIYQLLNSY